MKKKIVAMCATVAIAAIAVGGTLAFFQDKDEATNTFTVGDVDITLAEPGWTDESKLIPGTTIPKDPTVTVEAGSEECYVRMLVTVSDLDALDKIFAPNGASLIDIFAGYDSAKWAYETETRNPNNDTITYEFRYHEPVSTVDAAARKLEPLFSNVVVPYWISDEQIATLNNDGVNGMTIEIVAQAIQKANMADADDAWGKFDENQD